MIWTFIGIAAVVLAGVAIATVTAERSRRDRMAARKAEFQLDEVFEGARHEVGISWSSRQVYFSSPERPWRAFPFSAVLDSEIDLDGTTISTTKTRSHTNRGSQVVGAAVGGLLLGPAGAVVGGLTGGSNSVAVNHERQFIRSLEVRVTIDDHADPIQRIVMIVSPGKGVAADNPIVRDAVAKADRFQALFTKIIRDNAETRRVAGE